MQELPLISRTLAAKMLTCIEEYERIKRKESKTFKTVKAFCQYHKFSHQNFMKIYHHYRQQGTISSLIPQKRGPKYQTRRTDLDTEQEILRLRPQGNNRYEIRNILLGKNMLAPSASTVYNL